MADVTCLCLCVYERDVKCCNVTQARYKLNPTGFPIYPTTFRQVLEGISPIFPTATEGISDYKLYFLSINDIKDKVHVYIFIS